MARRNAMQKNQAARPRSYEEHFVDERDAMKQVRMFPPSWIWPGRADYKVGDKIEWLESHRIYKRDDGHGECHDKHLYSKCAARECDHPKYVTVDRKGLIGTVEEVRDGFDYSDRLTAPRWSEEHECWINPQMPGNLVVRFEAGNSFDKDGRPNAICAHLYDEGKTWRRHG